MSSDAAAAQHPPAEEMAAKLSVADAAPAEAPSSAPSTAGAGPSEGAAAAPAEEAPHPSGLSLDERFSIARSVGEECINDEELRTLLAKKPLPVAYDGFEPSGRMHIAQGVMKAINVNRLTKARRPHTRRSTAGPFHNTAGPSQAPDCREQQRRSCSLSSLSALATAQEAASLAFGPPSRWAACSSSGLPTGSRSSTTRWAAT
jgi:hypothetical protein